MQLYRYLSKWTTAFTALRSPARYTLRMSAAAQLDRTLTLRGAVTLNLLDMIGVGPFITLPLLLAAMGGPQAMLGWVLGAVIALCDGLVWAELGAAMPEAGGTYHYCLLYTSPSPRDRQKSRMPSSA